MKQNFRVINEIKEMLVIFNLNYQWTHTQLGWIKN